MEFEEKINSKDLAKELERYSKFFGIDSYTQEYSSNILKNSGKQNPTLKELIEALIRASKDVNDPLNFELFKQNINNKNLSEKTERLLKEKDALKK